ncbi:MAG: hypothetical protein GY845_07015 [Planctomycetes bacterium]|nr:hypothetical protein [Planctomycetota bacterium]
MKAFIGRNLDEKDDVLINKIQKFIETFDIDCIGGERSESKPISQKVKERIEGCDIFVGVFTRDQVISSNGKVKHQKWHILRRKDAQAENRYSTSPWVIQESGFAIGRDRHLIFLIENGVVEFPELQGDMEYIPFEKEKIEDKWVNLSGMLNNITSSKEPEATVATEVEKDPDQKQPEQEIPPEAKDTRKDVTDDLLKAIHQDQNRDKAQEIFDKQIKPELKDEDERWEWQAYILRFSNTYGDREAFQELKELAKESKDNPEVLVQLACRYMDMGEQSLAITTYHFAISQSDLDNQKGVALARTCYANIAHCMTTDGDYEGAMLLLRKQLDKDYFREHKAKILYTMANISKEFDRIDRFFIYGEAALQIAPLESLIVDLRFDLALQYSKQDHAKLALLHYKKLLDIGSKTGANLNNLGVQYNRTGLKCKAINSYSEAMDKKEIFAIGNLAHKYLDGGFTKDAKLLLDKAIELEHEGSTNKRVITARQLLGNLTKEEDEKEKELLKDAEVQKEFRIKYSQAFLSNVQVTKNQIEGDWKTPEGIAKLTFNENTGSFQAIIRAEKQTLGSVFGAIALGLPKPAPTTVTTITTITGTIENLSIRFNKESKEEHQPSSLLGDAATSTTGLMVMAENMAYIEVMEKLKVDDMNYYRWERLPASADLAQIPESPQGS